MSYNIDAIEILTGELHISREDLLVALKSIEGLPETALDCLEDPAFYHDEATERLKIVPWTCEGSGHASEELPAFLGACKGPATLLLTWEGGDDFSGYIVDAEGGVTEGLVVQTVVPNR